MNFRVRRDAPLFLMRNCDCNLRPQFFDIHPDELETFLDGVDQVTNERVGNYHLFRCSVCRSFWMVEDVTRAQWPSERHQPMR